MDSFEFTCVGRIIFGAGKLPKAAELAANLGRRAMVITNAGTPQDCPIVVRLANALRDADVEATVLWQQGEPTVQDVDAAVEAAKAAGCEVLVGLGGGSAIDTAKAVAGILTNGQSTAFYMDGIASGYFTKPALPWIAIPTTAGTGAEVTRNAVIADPQRRVKASLRSEHLLATAVVIDPQLQVGLPKDVTARCGMDALAQLIESYTSINAGPMTDALALAGLRRAGRSLERAYADGSDLEARSDMALAAMLSGLTLANAGLGAVHGFAAAMGSAFPVPHGVVCGALLGPVMAANVAALRAQRADHPYLQRYATIGRILNPGPTLSDEQAAYAGARSAGELAMRMGIPRLGQFGASDADVDALVAQACQSSSMKYNPVTLDESSLASVLRSTL